MLATIPNLDFFSLALSAATIPCPQCSELATFLGEYSSAEIAYKRSLQIRVNTLGPSHLRTAIGQHRYANLLENLGRSNEAYQLYELSAKTRKDLFGLNHPMYSYDLD